MDEQDHGREQQAAQDSLIRGCAAVDMLTRMPGHVKGLAREHGAAALSHGRDCAKHNPDGPCACGHVDTAVRRQGREDARQDRGAPRHLVESQSRAQPYPFHECPQRSGQTQAQQYPQSRAEVVIGSIQGEVAQAEADDAAEEQPGQAGAREPLAEEVCPQGQQDRGQRQPAEIGRPCPEQTRAASRTDGGHGPQNGGEDCLDHL